MLKIKFFLLALLLSFLTSAKGSRFSTAGFYALENSGRTVKSFNPGWKFYKGEIDNPIAINFDDSEWQVVNLPHGVENIPEEASACTNYQGIVWYRKKFHGIQLVKGKKYFLHFEAIMGKSKIFINGNLVKEQFGGYLPAIIDISEELNYNGENVVAVMADNSNDPVVPPGKKQEVLDFTYFGGIYRDCWLISHNNIFFTDANYENIVGGGGLVISTSEISDEKATVNIKFHVRNQRDASFNGSVEFVLKKRDGDIVVKKWNTPITIKPNEDHTAIRAFSIANPDLWSPETPHLYDLYATIKDKNDNSIDGFKRRIGIRSIEFKGKDGLWLNGKPYEKKLIGANRHQDFATVGHALSNSLHWRDAKKLRDVGMTVIRNAHYPQDPAFMDACDELGLFVIVNTPGWQWWSKEPIFEERVYSDIRNMVRRDRNHASVFLWEPILNETWYPDHFARNTRDIVSEEFVNGEKFSACDGHIESAKFFPVLFLHPSYLQEHLDELGTEKTYLTREWGDNVDSWSSHNSNSRVHLSWGEKPMLIQANHYAKPHYGDRFTCLDYLERMPAYHIGGCLWHSFDHQRGYHPDPFYGGIMNNYRYPKTSYYMFAAQRDPKLKSEIYESGPMVYIAHEMTPFSEEDVTIYSNCDSVTLKVFENGKEYSYVRESNPKGIKYPIITFKSAWDFFAYKDLSRANKYKEAYMEAKGYMNGELVSTHKIQPSIRPSKIKLWADDENLGMQANGSDLVVIHAMVTDENDRVKRLNNQILTFELEGEGELVFSDGNFDNSVKVEYGVASVLVRSTVRPGDIKIIVRPKYEGIHSPEPGSIKIKSMPSKIEMVYDEKVIDEKARFSSFKMNHSQKDKNRKVLEEELKVIEKQQDAFGEKK